jgi:hypothetical protein
MIRSFTATTREIDDIEAAVAEILTALEPKKNMLKNSLGIISCFSEFEETGALKAICEALPFECIGSTTHICSADKQTDLIIFAITVLTSDDCSFETVAIHMTERYEENVKSALLPLINSSDEKPSLLLTFLPLISIVGGDAMIAAIDNATGGVPLFGTTAIDHTIDYQTSKTIHNGQMFREHVVLGLIRGSVSCTFEIASLDENKIRKQKAIITESNDNILISINDKPALEYFAEVGLKKEELSLGLLPLVVDYKNGTKPIARSIFAFTPEDYVVCGGAMPVGATLAIGRVDMSDVLSTTEKVLKQLVEKDCLLLSYSCMARYLALGLDNFAEAEKMGELSGDMQYLFACSGGEICPLPDASGKLKNYFHNYTNVFCKLH